MSSRRLVQDPTSRRVPAKSGAFGFPNVSLQGGYGLEADYTYSGGSAFLIGTVGGGLSVVGSGTLGFHIYL